MVVIEPRHLVVHARAFSELGVHERREIEYVEPPGGSITRAEPVVRNARPIGRKRGRGDRPLANHECGVAQATFDKIDVSTKAQRSKKSIAIALECNAPQVQRFMANGNAVMSHRKGIYICRELPC